jgi:hypothetical protein
MAAQDKNRTIETGLLLEPAFVTIPHGAKFLGQGQSTIYKLIGLGKIEAAKAGKRTLLKVPSLRAYAASLPPASIKPPTVRKPRSASQGARMASRNKTDK